MKQFRGLTKDGKWVYGWYCEVLGYHYITPNDANIVGVKFPDTYGIIGSTEVIPETVGQQLPFDAQNGDKIYEGDVAKHSCGALFVIESTKVGWNPFDEHCVKPRRIDSIIGNVHQNPELLEKPK